MNMLSPFLRKHYSILIISIGYLILFIPFLGNVHLFDWDEINFAEAAREMLVTGDWLNVQINFEPFWEKPPLFIWIQAISMSIFENVEFAARFPNVIVGLVSILVIYTTVLKRYGLKQALLSVLLFVGSFTPHFYFKTGIIDPLFNLFIFLSVVYLIKAIEEKYPRFYFNAGFYLGLAILTKGPVALLLVGLTGLFFQIIYRIHFYSLKDLLMLVSGICIIPGAFFGIQIYQNGSWFLTEFIRYQIDLFLHPVASHGQPFYYHILVLLVGCFPVFTLSIFPLLFGQRVSGNATFIRFMSVLFWVVLIVFSLVTTKIVHYSSMCYIPVSIIGGVWLSEYVSVIKISKILTFLVGLFWTAIYFTVSIPALKPDSISIILSKLNIKDHFVIQILQTTVDWSVLPLFLGVLILVEMIVLLRTTTFRTISLILITNAFITTVFIFSVVPSVEHITQGLWVNQLKSYQNSKKIHYTYGFKSYAHFFYTHQKNSPEINSIKLAMLEKKGLSSFYELNQHEQKELSNSVRDYVIKETVIPITLSAKIDKFKEVNVKYPELKLVFEGNGYGVWER